MPTMAGKSSSVASRYVRLMSDGVESGRESGSEDSAIGKKQFLEHEPRVQRMIFHRALARDGLDAARERGGIGGLGAARERLRRCRKVARTARRALGEHIV